MVTLDGESLTIEDVHRVARLGEKVGLASKARKRVRECRAVIQGLVDSGDMIYGVTTGIGELAKVKVLPEHGRELQKRIVYSHAAGFGDPFAPEEARAAMLLRANCLAKGYSAVRLELLETMVEMINREVLPVMCQKGSVGTSGDLAPLSQFAEVVIGEGEAWFRGKRMAGKDAMMKAGLKCHTLEFKEGLGIINGSQMFTAVGALALYDGYRLFKTAQVAAAMSIEALQSPLRALDERIHGVRPFHGQVTVAANLRNLLDGSEMMVKVSRQKVQDAYSLRCTPQILGPTLDALHYVRSQIETEMNSAADNPLFFARDKAHLAGGNFHGQPVALALDFMAIAMCEVGDLSERHTNRLLNPNLSGLPGFLVEGKGLNSGLMVSQYTAAALLSENRIYAHPSTIDNVSVSADQEDHVCMGPVAAMKARRVLDNLVGILAIQFMCAAQAFDFRKPLAPAPATAAVHRLIRKHVGRLVDDRPLYPDIEKIARLVKDLSILEVVEKVTGPLGE